MIDHAPSDSPYESRPPLADSIARGFPAIDPLNRDLLGAWWHSDTSLVPFQRPYTRQEQRANERQMREMIEQSLQALRAAPNTEAEQDALLRQMLLDFASFGQRTIGLTEAQVEYLMTSGLLEVGREFCRAARSDAPDIGAAEILQALRNVWTMNGLQMFMGLPVALTPSIFAYSMLYPYTDNYLDDETVAPEEKRAFSERFARRLRGDDVSPANPQEVRIFAMVETIEDEHDRERYPQVYDSLLAIHRGQTKSLRLLASDAAPYEVDVLGIAFEKGGTSVMADGYLVARNLTPEQARFLYGWGATLQLVDDLQDVEPDRKAGLLTIFSQVADHWPLDRLTNRAMNLGDHVMQGLDAFDAPGIEPLKELTAQSVKLLLLYAAGGARRYHSRRYIGALENYASFRFSAVRRAMRDLERHRALLEAWFLSW